MATTGTATINFGANPGGTDTQIVITGQTGILAASSMVDAWIVPATTSDHSPDEHFAEPIEIMAGNIVDNTGFTIYAKCLFESSL